MESVDILENHFYCRNIYSDFFGEDWDRMKQMFAHMEKMTAAAAQAADAPSCPFCPAEILMGTTFVVTWSLLVLLQIFLLVRLWRISFGRARC